MDGRQVDEMLMEHMGLVEKVARRNFMSRCDDDDLLQCGRIGLWEAIKAWPGGGSFEPYACACIRNNMLDYLRATKKYGPTLEPQDDDLDADEEAEDKMLMPIDFEDRLDRLPSDSRDRLVLGALCQGMSKSSIAEVLEVDRHTVTRIAKRAWEKIKEEPD